MALADRQLPCFPVAESGASERLPAISDRNQIERRIRIIFPIQFLHLIKSQHPVKNFELIQQTQAPRLLIFETVLEFSEQEVAFRLQIPERKMNPLFRD